MPIAMALTLTLTFVKNSPVICLENSMQELWLASLHLNSCKASPTPLLSPSALPMSMTIWEANRQNTLVSYLIYQFLVCLFLLAVTANGLNDIVSHFSLDVRNKSLGTFYWLWPWSLGSINVCRFEW